MSLKETRGLLPIAMGVAAVLAVIVWQVARTRPHDAKAPRTSASRAPDPFAPAVVETLVTRLRAAPEGSPAWLAASGQDRDALARAEQLANVLAGAGWAVHPVQRTPQRNRPGYFLFVGGDEAPAYVDVLGGALKEAGLNPTVGVGYRAYAAEQSRANPSWTGIAFAPGQTFVLVVGRAPD